MLKKILLSNKILFWLGTIHLIIFLLLLVYLPFNKTIVLGINALIKPMKFALSIWLYSWTMIFILYYFTDKKKIKTYSWVAVITMCFEQVAITTQALRGQLSHFNISTAYGTILFSTMGVFILIITLYTAYITYHFFKQRIYTLPFAIVVSIKIGLVYFIVFSLFGGYISSLKGHTIGNVDGGAGLWFLNWSTLFGDLRVAHFFGIHSLQILPLVGITASKVLSSTKALYVVKLFAVIYLLYVLHTMLMALMGLPFIKSLNH